MLTAGYVTQVAVMAGMLTALKFALSFLPNVEVITLLIAVFSTVWGVKYSAPATVVFCLVEMAIYGIAGWVILYFVYWPTLAVVFHFALHKKTGWKALAIATGIGVLFSVLFGVLSASVETTLVLGNVPADKLGTFFLSYYVKGLWFDLVHTVSVLASVVVLYLPLTAVGQKIKRGMLNFARQNKEQSTASYDNNSDDNNSDDNNPDDSNAEDINADDGVDEREI